MQGVKDERLPTMLKRVLICALALLIPQPALAEEFRLGDIVVQQPTAKPTTQTAMTSAGYLTIHNAGELDDALIAIEADFPRVETHTTVMNGDVAQMQRLVRIPLPAGETVTFAPGGLHVMFMGLGGDPFEIGEEIPATLVLERAGRLEIVFTVSETDAALGHDHH